QALRTATAGNNAEFDFRLPEFCPCGSDANIASERQFAAAAQAEAVYHGNHRFREVFHCVESAATFHHSTLFDGSHPGKFTDVSASDECLFARPGDDDNAHPLIFFQMIECREDVAPRRRVQSI